MWFGIFFLQQNLLSMALFLTSPVTDQLKNFSWYHNSLHKSKISASIKSWNTLNIFIKFSSRTFPFRDEKSAIFNILRLENFCHQYFCQHLKAEENVKALKPLHLEVLFMQIGDSKIILFQTTY